ncbi:MAG TPA: FecR family protein [Quisquiliibacterium sp.]|nr:FecR family protein [Quisquiliibacterium sp.]HPA88807.1 FecR family protein [Quisquiliibacterium sp.]HQD82063.1 FecR family protein [Quisquiliibacterium sp.]HQN11723.1 FecR family protein [Quisquiliibacterium sp.]HQP65013.1 FecR family protein [Quisquiliibacterium sp.]
MTTLSRPGITALPFERSRRPASGAWCRWWSLAAALLWGMALSLAAMPAAANDEPRTDAAVVAQSSGETRLMRPSALLMPLRPDEIVRSGDRVLTGADGRVELRFLDGGVMVVQPNSDFKVEAFRYDANGEKGFFALAKGALRAVSGAIGKRNQADYRLTTPTATIGIRGTEYEASETPCGNAGCAAGERPGLTVKVIRGRVAVTNAAGTTEVPEGATLYVRTASTPATFGNGAEPPAPRPQTPRPQGAGRPSGNGNGGGNGGAGGGGGGGGGGSATGGAIREYFGGPDRLLERAPTLY